MVLELRLNTNSLISVGISKHLFSIGSSYFQNLIILILVFMKTKYFWIGEYKKLILRFWLKVWYFWQYPEEGGDIKQIIVGSMNIDTSSVKSKLKTKTSEVEHWLNKQKWYSHDSGIPHIKLFWLYVLIRRDPRWYLILLSHLNMKCWMRFRKTQVR
jgi:hypothetical protein